MCLLKTVNFLSDALCSHLIVRTIILEHLHYPFLLFYFQVMKQKVLYKKYGLLMGKNIYLQIRIGIRNSKIITAIHIKYQQSVFS